HGRARASGHAAYTDSLVVPARNVSPFERRNRAVLDDRVASVETVAQQRIGQARFALYGHSAYPDATFTLRLSYGTVKGYPMNGTRAPYKTTFAGLYDRSYDFDGAPPYNLAPRFVERRARLDLATPLDFVTTNDIIG